METAEIDFDARYTVKSMPGVAFWLAGWAQEQIPERWARGCDLNAVIGHVHDDSCDDEENQVYCEPELVNRDDMVRAVMVGDDREHLVDVADLVMIGEEDYCPGCGQTGHHL